jgi:DNA polymerase III subunit epsilon
LRLRRSPEGVAAAFAQAERPADATPWRDAGWCALDLEMTGLDPRREEIIAIGAVPIDEGRIVLGGGLYTLVRTTRRSQHGAVLVHKLRVPDLADAPPLEEALDRMLEMLAGRVPVFHTAAIERSFLERQFSGRHVRLPAAADTEALGRAWLRHRDGSSPEGISLGRLARVLGQPAETPHHALGDALTTAKAFIALAALLDTVAPQTVGSLLAASRPSPAAGGWRFGPG